MSAVTEILVDARGLEPPEPLERVLTALESLQAGQRLRFLIHRQPYPLYELLRRYHYRFITQVLADGSVEVIIWISP
jgi:uncharacterized protein (DUF2249 family)